MLAAQFFGEKPIQSWRSSEVWTVLGAVKTEFGKFGEVLANQLFAPCHDGVGSTDRMLPASCLS